MYLPTNSNILALVFIYFTYTYVRTHVPLRTENVRSTEKDTIEMQRCYRINDRIIAKISNNADSAAMEVRTSENELGVIAADSVAGIHYIV